MSKRECCRGKGQSARMGQRRERVCHRHARGESREGEAKKAGGEGQRSDDTRLKTFLRVNVLLMAAGARAPRSAGLGRKDYTCASVYERVCVCVWVKEREEEGKEGKRTGCETNEPQRREKSGTLQARPRRDSQPEGVHGSTMHGCSIKE